MRLVLESFWKLTLGFWEALIILRLIVWFIVVRLKYDVRSLSGST